MHVDDDGVRDLAQRARHQLAVDGGDRIVGPVHEGAAHGIDHQHARAGLGSIRAAPGPGAGGKLIGRISSAPAREDQIGLLVPDMIAEGYGVHAGVQQPAEIASAMPNRRPRSRH